MRLKIKSSCFSLLLPALAAAACSTADPSNGGPETQEENLIRGVPGNTVLDFGEVFLEAGVESTTPGHNERNVDRTVERLIVKYSQAIDCANPIRGRQAFRVSTTELAQGRPQDIYDQMLGHGGPQIDCDDINNEISMRLPGPLVGAAEFTFETQARAIDGTVMRTRSRFYTRDPGLRVLATAANTEINSCDTGFITDNSSNCDIYIVSRAKASFEASDTFNTKLPQGQANWNDWSLNDQKILNPAVVLYQSSKPVGDPFVLNLAAWDSDDGDTMKNVLKAVGIATTAAGAWVPAAAQVGAGVTGLAELVPPNTDDYMGESSFHFSKANRWGVGFHRLALDGRAPGNQIVLNVVIEEEPRSWQIID